MRFFDTNVLVYAIDGGEPVKRRIAEKLVRDAIIRRDSAVSIQVLTEFSNVAMRKLGQSPDAVRHQVSTLAQRLVFVEPRVEHLLRALEIHAFCRISIWDALIVAAAESAGCDTILSEDLSPDQDYCGIHVENPFEK